MHAVLFIQDLAVIMLIAAVITILCHRFKQPVVLGYILAGIIIGPYTPPFMFIHDEKIIKTLAELGVIFLMFSLGLEFDLHKLKRVGLAAFIAAFAEIILMILLGYGIGRLFNWSSIDSLFLGAILAISSTTIIIKALEDLGMKRERFAHLIFGILIIEDIFAIAILALLSTVATTGTIAFNDIMVAITKLSSFLVISLMLGILLIPKILTYVSKFNNREMLLITSLGLCFGFCLLVSKLNYSVALGAFLIGAIIAESEQLKLIARLVVPLRDTFSAIFFVSVGLLFNPKFMVDYAVPIIVITIIVVLGKIVSGSLGMLITGQDGKTSMRVGMGLAQIGEFSFIIAQLGMTLKVTSHFLYPIAVAVSAITTLLTPHLIEISDPFTNYLSKRIPKPVVGIYIKYSKWLKSLKPQEESTGIVNLIQRSIFLVVLNLLIIIAIFLFVDSIPDTRIGKQLLNLAGQDLQMTITWNLALILSLPFFIAVYRKLHALSLLLTGIVFKINNVFEERTTKISNIFAFLVSTLVLLGTIFLILSITTHTLPPARLLIPAMIIPTCLVVFLLPWFVRMHAKLQLHLTEAISKKK